MADKKEKMVWVKAVIPVQKPDRTWAGVGDVFEVPESKKSKRSMEEPTKDEIKAAKAAAPQPEADPRDAKIAELEQALEDAMLGRNIAFEAADELQCELGEVLDKVKELSKPAATIGGAKKGEGGDGGAAK